jgi:diphthamide biosynthesis protein 4
VDDDRLAPLEKLFQGGGGTRAMPQPSASTDATDAYLVLGVRRDAPADEIRHAYHRLARLHHPDLAGTHDTEAFNDIQRAWEQLRESDARARYDADLRAQELADAGFESRVQEVDLGDMDYAEDAAGAGVWRLDCRCGEAFVLREDDLSNGIDVLQCLSCSLCIRPLYCAQPEPDG